MLRGGASCSSPGWATSGHFLDRVAAGRDEFERAQDVVASQVALRAARPLGMEFRRGPFDEVSLFAKTLAKIVRDGAGADLAASVRDDPAGRAFVQELGSDWRRIATTLAADRGPAPGDPPGPRTFTAQVERGRGQFLPADPAGAATPTPGGRPPPPPAPVEVEDLELCAENFDRWVFGPGVATEAERRAHLDGTLGRLVDRAGRDRPLAPDLVGELRRAGAEDARRLLGRIEAQRAEFDGRRQEWDAGLVALRKLEPLAAEFRAGPYGAGSGFARALEGLGR